MCLIAFAWRCHPDYPLLLAANRDEFHARPTRPSQFWEDRPDLLAGKDLQAGGTWMGITRGGRFAAVTNYRDPKATLPAPRSRGKLTMDFLTGETSTQEYLASVSARAAEYAGFNLLVFDGQSLGYAANSDTGPDHWQAGPVLLEPGVYGLSNARLNTPWPKLTLARDGMARFNQGPVSHDGLATIVSDRQLAPSDKLSAQGLNGDMDAALSAQFIDAGPYGTRATTTLMIDNSGAARWCERTFGEGGVAQSEQRFTL